jgi:hypothetical protein
MASLTLTPTVPGGGTAQDLLSSTIRVETGFRFPVPMSDNTWIESRDMEGRRRSHARPANPTGEGSVIISGATEAAMRDNLDLFQATVAAVNRWGGTLVYDPDNAAAVTYVVVAMDIAEAPNLDQPPYTWTRVSFSFECEPYGILDSVTIASNQTASLPLLVFDAADVPGHVDALGELLTTDTATQERWYVEYGIEEITNASANDLILSQPDLTATGLAGSSNTRTGSYSTNTYRATLTTTPVAVCSTGSQPHVYADTALTYVRAEYRIGDGPWSSMAWALAIEDNWSDLFLGVIDVPEGETFEARVVAKCATAGGVLDVDIVYPFPADRWGRARRQLSIATPSVFSARDEFDQTAGALSGKTLPQGGTWSLAGGSAGDWSVNATSHTAERTGLAGTLAFALAGAGTPSAVVVQATVKFSAYPTGSASEEGDLMVLARYSTTSNYLRGGFELRSDGTAKAEIALGLTSLAYNEISPPSVNTDYVLTMLVDVAGRAFLFIDGELVALAQHADLVAGGATDDGQVGLFDLQTAGASTRTYNNFAAWVPEAEAAIFSGQSMRFLHDQAQRENAAGTKWGRVPVFEGQHFKVPVAGREDRTSRIAVRARRTDITEMPDGNLTDALRADLTVYPRVLLTSG